MVDIKIEADPQIDRDKGRSSPMCPHCEQEITSVVRRHLGIALVFSCPKCNKTGRKPYGMGGMIAGSNNTGTFNLNLLYCMFSIKCSKIN